MQRSLTLGPVCWVFVHKSISFRRTGCKVVGPAKGLAIEPHMGRFYLASTEGVLQPRFRALLSICGYVSLGLTQAAVPGFRRVGSCATGYR